MYLQFGNLWHNLMPQICQWKNTVKSFHNNRFIWNLPQLLEFVWYLFIVVVALLQKFRCPPMVAFEGKKTHIICLYSGKHPQCNNRCMKLVLKSCNDLLYINIWKYYKLINTKKYHTLHCRLAPYSNQQYLVINWF